MKILYAFAFSVLLPAIAFAMSMGDETRTAWCFDPSGSGNHVTYDPNSPPSPAPDIQTCYIAVQWNGETPFNIPAWWSVDQINAVVQSEIDRYNNPPINTQTQLQNAVTQ